MTKADEAQEKTEKQRVVAMLNLSDGNLTTLAATYFMDKSGQYGEAVNSAVESHAYASSMAKRPSYIDSEGNEVDLVMSSLVGSRQDGKRYTGKVSEYEIIKTASEIIKESLGGVKVGDVLKLMGSKKSEEIKHPEKYVFELIGSKNEEDKKLGQEIAVFYIQYLQDKVAGDALAQKTKAVRGGLEKMLTEDLAA